MTTQQELASWLALWRLPGIGPATFHQIRRLFPELAMLFESSPTAWKPLKLSPRASQSLKSFCQGRDRSSRQGVERDLAWLEGSAEHSILTCVDPGYPSLLRELEQPPPLLFVKGHVDVLELPQLAIVGSRHCSKAGKRTSGEFAEGFARAGIVVTSGLALGVDGAAHEGALAVGGQSIAVLAHGLDQVYPPRHELLAQQLASQGALLSAYPVGVKPRPEYFPQRNRIISGLAVGVLVVEAARQSGSLITAYEASAQGREVFAIPGAIQDPLAAGCHELIRRGATLVESPAQVVAELGSLLGALAPVLPSAKQAVGQPADQEPADQRLAALLAVLAFEPQTLDQLQLKLPWSAAELSAALMELELTNDIELVGQGYVRCR